MKYVVIIRQNVPTVDFNEYGEEVYFNSDSEEVSVAGHFSSAEMAAIFAEALEQKIAEESQYVVTFFTPRVSVQKITTRRREMDWMDLL